MRVFMREGKGEWGDWDTVRKLHSIKYVNESGKCLIKHGKRKVFVPKKICGICAEISDVLGWKW
jgi:hypothetical protein